MESPHSLLIECPLLEWESSFLVLLLCYSVRLRGTPLDSEMGVDWRLVVKSRIQNNEEKNLEYCIYLAIFYFFFLIFFFFNNLFLFLCILANIQFYPGF